MESKVNFLFAVLAVVIIASVAMLTYSCSTPNTLKYFPRKVSLEDAIAAAELGDKPVVALFAADWSEPCEKFKRRALADEQVAAWISTQSQPVLLDMTNADAGDGEAMALFNRFAIAEYPTIILLRKGVEVARLEGEKSAKDLLQWLREKGVKPTPAG